MKHKISISVDEETLLKIKEAMREGRFRNKSHAFEYAIHEILRRDPETLQDESLLKY